jgi:hypothetical protein
MPASPAQSSLTAELAVKKSVARFSNEDAVIEYGARYVGGPNGRVEDQTAWEGLRDVVDDFSQDGSCSDASYYIALRNEIALSPRPCVVSLVAASFHFRARHTRSSRHRFKLGLG